MNANLGNTKICVQKILPRHYEIFNKFQQGSLPEHHKLAAAFYRKKIWPQNSKIYITFLQDNPQILITPISQMDTTNGPIDPLQKKFANISPTEIPNAIKEIVQKRIQPLINLKLIFTDANTAKNETNHVKIDFDPSNGAWSLVGTDCVGEKGATMNLGWFDVATVMHEFGHVLGLIHEHQNPKGTDIQWNDAAVYTWAQNTQGWDQKTTQTNILNKYKSNQINGSSFDPLSIMLYFFPSNLTLNNKGTNQNLWISGEDALWLNKTYPPGQQTPAVYYEDVYSEKLQDSLAKSTYLAQQFQQNSNQGSTKDSHNNILKWVVIGIIILLILVVIGIIIWYIVRKRVKK